ncbi:hypothetical protein [Streptomyces sp. WAC06614]|uniref:hypothetical protein n=1 Tax=Streptomyces sp. WAC06614 TaxID=2487416 RepID=UPI000F79191F|nr:hypothetical protein [Streptomyces sp. WAC06614]RSS79141.1 hypothetical protein EF918_18350 [Streptomyces sp. WAC06614]
MHTARILVVAGLLGSCLTGCSLPLSFADCEGTEQRVAAVAATDLLALHPEGAVAPPGLAEVDSGCEDDSGDSWVSAGRFYAYPGDPGEVLRYYRTTAAQAGWREDMAPPRLCMTRSGLTFLLDFPTQQELTEIYRYTPPPGTSSGALYRIAVEGSADGTPRTC